MTAVAAPLIPVVEREGEESDLPFVFSSWLRSYRPSEPEMHTDDYFRLQHARITRLLERRAHIVVLHPVRAPGVIASWACLDEAPAVVHYVYSKGGEYSRRGYARQLLAGRTICTHLTVDGRVLKKALGLRYMPHLLDG